MSVVGSAQEMGDTGELEFYVGKMSIRRRYRVICSSVTDDSQVATSASGLPLLYSYYQSPSSTNLRLRARRYSARRLFPASLVWVVDVIFETPDTKEGTGREDSGRGAPDENPNQFTDPTQEYPDVEFETIQREEALTLIYDTGSGNIKPVTNSAGEPLDPPSKYMAKILRLRIERNEPLNAPHPALGVQYMNTVNADPFWGLPAGTWLCIKVTAKRATKQLAAGLTAAFLRVVYEFEGRPEWDLIILDAGRYYLLPPASAVTPASNLYTPMLPGVNPYSPTVAAPAPAVTLTPARFRPRGFITSEGHPRRAPLNGQGGPLPEATTYTCNGSILTIPAPSQQTPGVMVNGLAVQLFNSGGNLPSGLRPNTVYYVVQVDSTGLSFRLAQSFTTGYLTVPGCAYADGFNFLYAPYPLGEQIAVGALVVSPDWPSGTTVTSITYQGQQINNYLLILSNDATNSANTAGSPPGSAVTFITQSNLVECDGGSGINTLKCLGVFARVRAYNRVPFAPLGLPQSFTNTQ